MSDQTGKPVPGGPGSGQALGVDTRHAHSARVYNYWLGGKDNYAADREAAEQAIAANPGIVTDVRASRAFLARVVRYLAAECGIGQFLDIGTGLPTASNTHEVAQAAAPGARIVYVDNDPIVLAHGQALLTSTSEGATAYLDLDLRDTSAILRAAAQTLDFGQPIALMLLIILHLIPDADDPYGIVATLVQGLVGRQLPRAGPPGQRYPRGEDGRNDQAGERAHERAQGDHARPRRDHPVLRRAGPARAGRGPAPAVAARARHAQPAPGNSLVRGRPETVGTTGGTPPQAHRLHCCWK